MSDSTQNEPGESDDVCLAGDHEHCESCGKCDDGALTGEHCHESGTTLAVCRACARRHTKGCCK